MKVSLLALLTACGSVAPAPDASSDATIESSVDAMMFDAPPEADAEQPLADGGLFLCVDCLCDGRTSYCRGFFKGNAPITDAGAPDAAMCEVDAGLSGCFAYPDACAQAPTCGCLVASQIQPACGCAEVEGGVGFDVSCYLP